MSFISQYINDATKILELMDQDKIERMIQILLEIREKQGRLFLLGVGGSAGNCIHAANDFRKLSGIETYSPAENVAEITARTNDEGWHTVFAEWLKCSHINEKDAVLVFSVGGGNKEKNVSANLVYALKYAKEKGSSIVGVVGRDGGYTAQVADACCLIPVLNPSNITPHTEGFQAVVWHALVSHPKLKKIETKWESVS